MTDEILAGWVILGMFGAVAAYLYVHHKIKEDVTWRP